MVNVNVTEQGWKTVKANQLPGESFAKTFDRILENWKELSENSKLKE